MKPPLDRAIAAAREATGTRWCIGCAKHRQTDGCPDLLVGWHGMTILFEVKDGKKPPSKRRLTQEQVDWHAAWRGGMVAIVESPEAALALLEVRT